MPGWSTWDGPLVHVTQYRQGKVVWLACKIVLGHVGVQVSRDTNPVITFVADRPLQCVLRNLLVTSTSSWMTTPPRQPDVGCGHSLVTPQGTRAPFAS
jgi:hypothetical protein